MKPVPIRLHVMAAFVATMTVGLALIGWLLYGRVAADLDNSIDRSLRQRAQDLSALIAEPGSNLDRLANTRFVEGGDSYAELLDAQGHVLEATPELHDRLVISSQQLRSARRGPIYVDHDPIEGLTDPSRLLAVPVSSAPVR